jgi:hypothetical protein
MSDGFALAEAYWRLGWLTAIRARAAALDAIAEGHDAPALYDILDGGYGTAAEVHDLFARALAELGHPPSSPEDAALYIVQAWARTIVSGSLTPDAGAQRNWHGLWVAGGMPDALLPLIYLSSSYEMYYGVTPAPEYLADVVAAAHDLLKKLESTPTEDVRRS